MNKQEKNKILRRIKYNFGMCNLEEWFQCFKEDFEEKMGIEFWKYHENNFLQKSKLEKQSGRPNLFHFLLRPLIPQGAL